MKCSSDHVVAFMFNNLNKIGTYVPYKQRVYGLSLQRVQMSIRSTCSMKVLPAISLDSSTCPRKKVLLFEKSVTKTLLSFKPMIQCPLKRV